MLRRSRILIYGLNFAPEPTATGKYTGELAQWLAHAGHDVRAICAPPYYPNWSVATPYSSWRYGQERWEGVRVFRAPIWVPQRPSGGKRMLHLASFAVSSLPLLLQNLAWRPHLIFCVAPTLMCAPGAAAFARLSGSMSWLHVQDFEVDSAFELGLLRGPRMHRAASNIERILFRSFDRVSSISQRMVAWLREKGVAPGRALLFPNWVDTDAIRPMSYYSSYRRDLGIPQSAFVALYSGTMGLKQGLEVLAETAGRLAEQTNIHFIFCGQGAGYEELRNVCAGMRRVHWLPLQPAERLSELLSTADVHLLPQKRAAADFVLPSKLTGMLASGRPVLSTADPGTELAEWIEGCGDIVEPGDGAALAQRLLALSRDLQRCRDLGACARTRALTRLSRDIVMERFCKDLDEALAAR